MTSRSKLRTTSELREVRQNCEDRRSKFVWTNGCFDLLHPGHVASLQFAKDQGHVLAVGLNSDASVKRLKGESRPICPIEDRLYMLSALACVDHVVLFGGDSPADLIRDLRPDVVVKGWEYRGRLTIADFVGSYGGIVAYAPDAGNHSTTSLIERIRDGH